MNQILVVGNKNGKRNNSTVDIKKIILFFSIAIIIFGAVLIIEGAVGLGKNKNENNNNPIAVETIAPTTENPVEDDEEAPTIELILSGATVKIIARDETEIDYLEYGWNDEEKKVVNSTSDKNRIDASIELKQGVNTLKVKAVDKAGNENTKENDFKGEYDPVVNLFTTEEKDGLIIIASCDDGISKIEFTQNGDWYRLEVQDSNYSEEEFASMGVIPEYSSDGKIVKVKYTYKNLVEGENRFSVYVYSTEGRVGGADGYCTYNSLEQ